MFCNYYPTIIWILYAIFLKYKTLLPNRLLSTGTLILLSCIPKSCECGHHGLLVPSSPAEHLVEHRHQNPDGSDFENEGNFHKYLPPSCSLVHTLWGRREGYDNNSDLHFLLMFITNLNIDIISNSPYNERMSERKEGRNRPWIL